MFSASALFHGFFLTEVKCWFFVIFPPPSRSSEPIMKNGFKSGSRRKVYFLQILLDAKEMVWKHGKSKKKGLLEFLLQTSVLPVIISGENHPRNTAETCIAGLFLYIIIFYFYLKNRREDFCTWSGFSRWMLTQAGDYWCLKRSPKFSMVASCHTDLK